MKWKRLTGPTIATESHCGKGIKSQRTNFFPCEPFCFIWSFGPFESCARKRKPTFFLSGKSAKCLEVFFYFAFCHLVALTAASTFQGELKNAWIRHCIFLQLCCSKGAQLFEISEKSLLSRFCNEITFQWGTQHKLFIAHETWCMLLLLTSKGKFLLTYYSFH